MCIICNVSVFDLHCGSTCMMSPNNHSKRQDSAMWLLLSCLSKKMQEFMSLQQFNKSPTHVWITGGFSSYLGHLYSTQDLDFRLCPKDKNVLCWIVLERLFLGCCRFYWCSKLRHFGCPFVLWCSMEWNGPEWKCSPVRTELVLNVECQAASHDFGSVPREKMEEGGVTSQSIKH